MATPSITIRGLREVSAVLKKMDKPAAVRLVRKAFRRALVPVRDRTKELAPVKTGALAAAVKIMAGRTNRGLIRQRVVIGRGKGADKNSVFYGSQQELGFRLGPRKLGNKRRKIEGKHFMKQAYDQTGQAASDRAEEYLWDEILKVWKP
jgi:hypothetical protein